MGFDSGGALHCRVTAVRIMKSHWVELRLKVFIEFEVRRVKLPKKKERSQRLLKWLLESAAGEIHIFMLLPVFVEVTNLVKNHPP